MEKQLILGFRMCLNPKFLNLCNEKTAEYKLAKNAFRTIVQRFFYINKDLHFISEEEIVKISRADFDFFCELLLGREKLFFYDSENQKEYRLFDSSRLLAFLRLRQVTMVDYEIDPFAKKNSFDLYDATGGKRLLAKYSKIHLKEPKEEIPRKRYNEIVSDYKAHFPDLDDVLDFIVASRFTENRKSTFLHLLVRSNWGKSFFSAVLLELGVGYEIRYSDITEDKPIGVNPLEVLSSFCLILDEFKYFSKEMKKLTTEMTIEPKFGFKSKVPIYAKLLLSAEESESFADGVDEQIINRVIKISYVGDEVMRLDDRPIFRKYGAREYKGAIKKYVYEYLSREIEKYVALGAMEADRTAESRLIELAKDRKLTVSNLRAEIMRVFIEFFESYKTLVAQESASPKLRDLQTKIFIDGDKYYIKAPAKTLVEILRMETDDSFFAKAKHKKAEIIDILDPRGGRSVRVRGMVFWGIEIDLADLRSRYVRERGEIEIFGVKTKTDENEIEKTINSLLRDWRDEGLSNNEIEGRAKELERYDFSIVPIYKNGELVKVEVADRAAAPF